MAAQVGRNAQARALFSKQLLCQMRPRNAPMWPGVGFVCGAIKPRLHAAPVLAPRYDKSRRGPGLAP